MFLVGAVEYLSPFFAVLGPIVSSLQIGTRHRGAFEVPISYLIELQNLQFGRKGMAFWFFTNTEEGVVVGVNLAAKGTFLEKKGPVLLEKGHFSPKKLIYLNFGATCLNISTMYWILASGIWFWRQVFGFRRQILKNPAFDMEEGGGEWVPQANSNGEYRKLNFQVSGRISVVMSTFWMFGLSDGRFDNEFWHICWLWACFDPLQRNKKLCSNL